jgi:hypothetical protein
MREAKQRTISFPLSPAAVLYLITGEVCIILDRLDEWHLGQSQQPDQCQHIHKTPHPSTSKVIDASIKA